MFVVTSVKDICSIGVSNSGWFWLGWRYTWPFHGVLSPYDCRVINGRFCLGLSVKGTSEEASISFVHNVLLGGILRSSAENLHPVHLELDMGF